MKAPFRTKFDPAQDFAARRQLTVGGRTFFPGEDIDKSLLTERKLRLLFEHRSIVYRQERTAPGGNLSPEEAAQTRRGQHSKRAAENAQRMAGLAAQKGKAKAKPKGDPRETHLERRQASQRETFADRMAIAKARRKVVIPPDWKSLPWPKRLQLAAQLTDEKVRNGEDVEKAITKELERRGQRP